MSKFKTEEFKNLRSEWYEKLKDSGFNDIEYASGELKTVAYEAFRVGKNHGLHHKDIAFKNEFKAYYYRKAFQFYENYKFEHHIDKVIWGMHCDEKSLEEILNYCNENKIGYTEYKLRKMIKTFTKLMRSNYDD